MAIYVYQQLPNEQTPVPDDTESINQYLAARFPGEDVVRVFDYGHRVEKFQNRPGFRRLAGRLARGDHVVVASFWSFFGMSMWELDWRLDTWRLKGVILHIASFSDLGAISTENRVQAEGLYLGLRACVAITRSARSERASLGWKRRREREASGQKPRRRRRRKTG